MKTNSKSGFSLVELMVVVAIIGILATVGGPNFIKYQRKAKQTSAKTELSGVYTSEKAFFVEYSEYSPSLSKVGFVPEGWTNPCADSANVNIRPYSVGFNDAHNAAKLTAGAESCIGQVAFAWGAGGKGAAARNASAAPRPTGTDVTAGANGGFVAAAAGILGGTNTDLWTMSNNNELTNATSGI